MLGKTNRENIITESPLILVDSHVHLDDERLQNQQALVDAARQANVVAQVVPGIARRWWPRLRETCSRYPDAFPCYGLHPCFMDDHKGADLTHLADWIQTEHPVAVGECGLDYFVPSLDKSKQQQLFSEQLSLAKDFDLPIVIHARKSVDDVIHMIRAAGHHRGMVHSFGGSMQQAKQLIDLGYYISLGGAITYPRAKRLHRLAKELPLDSLLLETDAPDQVVACHKGQLNQPAYLLEVFRHIRDLRMEDAETIAQQTTKNAVALYRLPSLAKDA